MVTKHVLRNQTHKSPASSRLSLVLYEILRTRRGEIMKRLLLLTALVLGAATILQAKEITVRGKLQKTVESGGWLIAASDAKYLILNPRNFQSNAWFKESTNVEAVGEVKEVMTTFMEGTPFEVRTMQPADQAATTTENKRTTRVM